ncbi:MAG: GGDEF domain-containing protein, partial [Deltaproteobacteria bacterium]|nr:GGDEF domain-containing protein [Deltaproteobacteria bacterium]
GQLLMINLREVDTVARFGGEEFVLLLPDTDKRGAIAVAEKVRRIVRERMPMEDSAEDTKITISGGIAHYPDDVKDMEDLIDHADIALYRAKEQGRDQVVCFAPPKPKVADEAEPQQVIPTLLAAKKKFFTTMQ